MDRITSSKGEGIGMKVAYEVIGSEDATEVGITTGPQSRVET